MLRTPSLPLLAPAALALLLAVAARAEDAPHHPPAMTPAAPSLGAETLKPGKPAVKPYLADAAVPDAVQILPAPPAHDAPLAQADPEVQALVDREVSSLSSGTAQAGSR